MSRALKQRLHCRGADVRLQLKEALASLHVKELQTQSVWTVEHLLQQGVEPQQLDGFIRDLFAGLKECSPAVRRLCYKCVARAKASVSLELRGGIVQDGGLLEGLTGKHGAAP
jgi:hypothetical protein